MMKIGTWIWGGLLILIGVLLLLENLGIITVNVWGLIWPLLLVGLGVWLLVGASSRKSGQKTQVSIPASNAAAVQIWFQHGAGKLDVKSGSSGQLLSGVCYGGVEVSEKRSADRHEITLRSPRDYLPFGWLPAGSLDWSFEIQPGITLNLVIESGAQESNLDLTDLKVSSLKISTGASKNRIQLPAQAGVTQVNLSAGMSEFVLLVPSGVAARIRSSSGLSSINIDRQRFAPKGKEFQSPDYDMASNRVDIFVESGLANITIQ